MSPENCKAGALPTELHPHADLRFCVASRLVHGSTALQEHYNGRASLYGMGWRLDRPDDEAAEARNRSRCSAVVAVGGKRSPDSTSDGSVHATIPISRLPAAPSPILDLLIASRLTDSDPTGPALM